MSPPKYLALANRLVANLPEESRESFLDVCELVNLQRLDVLTKSGQLAEYAYFPLDSYISVVVTTENSNDVQVDLTGNEGMVNVSLVLGVRASALTSIVQGAGRAFRIHHVELQKLLDVDPILRHVLNLYMNLRMDQLARNMACASFHAVEQRLARWLLMVKDRAHSNELLLTQEVLSHMLGVRRERVTLAAGSLQKKELISYSRGDLMLVDQPGLEAAACGCYESDLAFYERAMGSLTLVQNSEPMNNDTLRKQTEPLLAK